jgi:MFS transporter, DHA1 family, inner membrane transport protein
MRCLEHRLWCYLKLLLVRTGVLSVSVVLVFDYPFFKALGWPSSVAASPEVPNKVRGRVLSFNITTASVGWLVAASGGA